MKRLIQYSALLAVVLTGLCFTSCASSSSSGSTGFDTPGATSRLKLHNKYYTDMVLRLEGPEKKDISIPARSNRSVTLKPGIYQYTSVVRGFRPVSRYKVFEANRSYALQF